MIIDVHCHLQFPAFDKDRDEIVQKSLKSGIGMINSGVDKKSSQKAVELAQKYKEGIYAAIGVHPHNVLTESFEDYEFFKKLAKDSKVVAIGECGLDYFRIKNNESEIKNLQKEIFIKHIQLAREINKPLMIHCRDAFDDLIDILDAKYKLLNTVPGVIHFFTGAFDDAKKLLEMGFYFTFGGLITYNRSFDEIIKYIPLERILSETDAPYVAPEPYRGKRNEPNYIIETVKKMAEIKNLSFEEVCKIIYKNSKKVFQI